MQLREVPSHRNDTNKTYQVRGFRGRVGFLASITHNFCGTYNWLRVTSDGNLKVGLFGNPEVSLRDSVRKVNGVERLRGPRPIHLGRVQCGDEAVQAVAGAAARVRRNHI